MAQPYLLLLGFFQRLGNFLLVKDANPKITFHLKKWRPKASEITQWGGKSIVWTLVGEDNDVA